MRFQATTLTGFSGLIIDTSQIMPDELPRPQIHHPRSYIPHHLSYGLPSGWGVTVGRADLAARLVLAIAAVLKPGKGIVAQAGTVRTELCRAVFQAAIVAYHEPDGGLFPGYL